MDRLTLICGLISILDTLEACEVEDLKYYEQVINGAIKIVRKEKDESNN